MEMACLFGFVSLMVVDGAATAAVVAIAAVLSYSMPLYFNAFLEGGWGVPSTTGRSV